MERKQLLTGNPDMTVGRISPRRKCIKSFARSLSVGSLRKEGGDLNLLDVVEDKDAAEQILLSMRRLGYQVLIAALDGKDVPNPNAQWEEMRIAKNAPTLCSSPKSLYTAASATLPHLNDFDASPITSLPFQTMKQYRYALSEVWRQSRKLQRNSNRLVSQWNDAIFQYLQTENEMLVVSWDGPLLLLQDNGNTVHREGGDNLVGNYAFDERVSSAKVWHADAYDRSDGGANILHVLAKPTHRNNESGSLLRNSNNRKP